MVANQFDLSAGFNVGISQVLAIGLQGQGWPWRAAVCAVLLMGAARRVRQRPAGHAGQDQLLHRDARHRHVLYGLNAWYTGGQQVLADLAAGVPGHFRQRLDRACAGDLRARSSASTLWVVFEYLPLGRYLYVLGASPRAAELNGISAKRYVTLASSRRERSPPSPASCCSRSSRSARARSARNICCRPSPLRCSARPRSGPGRVNVWGTVLAVAVLAVTVAGLNQLGAPFFVEPLFNGSMLILAVGLAVQAAQRRTAPRHARPIGRPLPPRPRRSWKSRSERR